MITSTRKQQNGSNSSRLSAETITNEYIHIESHSIPKSTIMTDSDMCLAQMFFCCFSLYFISFVRLSSGFRAHSIESEVERRERERKNTHQLRIVQSADVAAFSIIHLPLMLYLAVVHHQYYYIHMLVNGTYMAID